MITTIRTNITRLFIVFLSVLSVSTTMAQEQNQYALYNYRNDGDFNAWLNIDVDSITYSCIGLDSIEYETPVVQEVWTPDSLYRIPIAVIDSISFKAPKPEFKEGLFHIIEEHVPYTIGVDELAISFKSDIPSNLLPSIGQVVISDIYDEPFDIGFAGRVINIIYDDEKIEVICEEISLSDVYDQLIFVGKSIVYEDNEEASTRVRSPRRIKINKDGTWEVPLGKFSMNLKDPSAPDDSPISCDLSLSPSLNIDYTITYNVKGVEDRFRVIARPKVDIGLSYNIKFKKKNPNPIESILPAFIPIETPIPGVRSKVRFGAFLEVEGSISLKGELTYTAECAGGFDSALEKNNGFIFDCNGGWKDPKVSIDMEGNLFCGPIVQVYAYILYEKGFPCAKFNLKPGVEFSGKFVATTDAFTEYGFSAYDMLKDSKISLAFKLKADASASFLGKTWECPLKYSWAPDFAKLECYLFPKFTKPELKSLKSTFNPYSFYSEVTRTTLFSPSLGMAVYDENGNKKGENISINTYIDKTPKHTYVSHDISNYEPGKYLIRPFVKSLFGTFSASPVTEFTVPEPMSLELNTPMNSVTLNRGTELLVEINGGWGDYSASSSVDAICTSQVIKKEGNPYVKIVSSKNMTGSATVTVKDLRSGKTETILVTVSNDVIPVTSITLSDTSLTIQPGGTRTITATVLPENATNKSVTWKSNKNDVATVDENGVVTAVAEGTCTIRCYATDGSGIKKDCSVTVTSGTIPDADNHEYVDLGLPSGLLWATCNVGASKPEEYGDYFAWGETKPKTDYSWSTYKWGNNKSQLTKYCNKSSYGLNGFTDNKTTLDLADDAARANRGGKWRMPTSADFEELLGNTSNQWVTNYNGTGVNGRLFTANNGKSIFLPAAGSRDGTSLYIAGSGGRYWSSSLYSSYPFSAYRLRFEGSYVYVCTDYFINYRYEGHTVRPVRPKN